MLPARLLSSVRGLRNAVRPIAAASSPITGTPLVNARIASAGASRLLHVPSGAWRRQFLLQPATQSLPASRLSSHFADTLQRRHASQSPDILTAILTSPTQRDAKHGGCTKRRDLSTDTVQRGRQRRVGERIVLSGQLHAGVEKRKSVRRRGFASSTEVAKSSSKAVGKGGKDARVTWREALKSPRKAMVYSGQLRRDLVGWFKHIWAGAKLLAADVRVSSRILSRIVKGKQISRRERNFIVKTGVDLARLLPFSLFLIIPLAEFALPFALKLFPNMLPSQFQDQMKKEEDLKRRLKGRLEIAKYLRDVVEEKARTVKSSDANSELVKNAEDLTEFLEALRSGKLVEGANVARFARFFNDELTIDGAARPQLVAMCKYMGISPYGHDQFLRFKLRSRLNAIKRDDMQIMWEGGAESLTDEEVAKACRDRGIREGASNSRMRLQLKQWLDLSQKKEIPGSLLILSRALLYTGADTKPEASEEDLVDVLGSLPEDVIMDVKQAADMNEGSNADQLLERLRQAKLIELESEREARIEKEDDEKRKKKEAEEEVENAVAEDLSSEKPVHDESIDDKEVAEKVHRQESDLAREIIDLKEKPTTEQGRLGTKEDAEVASAPAETAVKDEEEVERERGVVRRILDSLGQLSSDSAVQREREELRNLKLELAEAEQFVKHTEGTEGSDLKRFKKMVSKLEKEVEKVDAKVGLRMKLLDTDNDGLMSLEEINKVMTVIVGDRDDEVVASTIKRLDADADGNVTQADLQRVLHELQFEYEPQVEEPPKQKAEAEQVSDEIGVKAKI